MTDADEAHGGGTKPDVLCHVAGSTTTTKLKLFSLTPWKDLRCNNSPNLRARHPNTWVRVDATASTWLAQPKLLWHNAPAKECQM